MTDEDSAWFLQEESRLQSEYAPHVDEAGNLGHLIRAGVPAFTIESIAKDAMWIYGVNRKGLSSHAGPVKRSAQHIWERLTRKDDNFGDFDLAAFAEYRPLTIETVVARTSFGVSAVKGAFHQLCEHGFADRKRDGRAFPTKLMVPPLALVEYADAVAEDKIAGARLFLELGIDLVKLGKMIKKALA